MNIKREMFKKLGEELFQQSVRMKKLAHNVKLKTIPRADLKFLSAEKGMYKTQFPDGRYWYPTKEAMKSILIHDFLNKKKYILHQFDCSSFAEALKNHLKEIYGINAVGVVKYTEQVYANTGEHKAPHRCNVLLVEENNELGLYLCEPQSDQIIKMEENKRYIFGKLEYKLENSVIEF